LSGFANSLHQSRTLDIVVASLSGFNGQRHQNDLFQSIVGFDVVVLATLFASIPHSACQRTQVSVGIGIGLLGLRLRKLASGWVNVRVLLALETLENSEEVFVIIGRSTQAKRLAVKVIQRQRKEVANATFDGLDPCACRFRRDVIGVGGLKEAEIVAHLAQQRLSNEEVGKPDAPELKFLDGRNTQRGVQDFQKFGQLAQLRRGRMGTALQLVVVRKGLLD